MPSKIAWTDESWNPVVGCTKVSAGCQNCYAEKMANRLVGMCVADGRCPEYLGKIDDNGHWTGQVECCPWKLEIPLHWKKPRRIFVCSMGDLFHPSVPFEFIDEVVQVIIACYRHTFLILTKRPEVALKYIQYMRQRLSKLYKRGVDWTWPENVIGMVTAENQPMADLRIPQLLQCGFKTTGVSIEPMLEGISLEKFQCCCSRCGGCGDEYPTEPPACHVCGGTGMGSQLDWVIIGCESGPKRRECKLEWVRDLVRQCKDANVAPFVKQLSINGKVEHDINKFPKDLQIREYPK